MAGMAVVQLSQYVDLNVDSLEWCPSMGAPDLEHPHSDVTVGCVALGNFCSLSINFPVFKMGMLGRLHDRKYIRILRKQQDAGGLLLVGYNLTHFSLLIFGLWKEFGKISSNGLKKKKAVAGR